MIYLMVSLCESSSGLRTIYTFKLAIEILSIIIPIILLVSVMIGITTALIKGDDNLLASVKSTIVNKSIAAILVFLVPTGVNLILSLVNQSNIYTDCYTKANKEYIAYKEIEERALAELEKEAYETEKARLEALIKAKEEARKEYYASIGGISNNIKGTDNSNYVNGSNTNTSVVSVDVSKSVIGCDYYATGVGVQKNASINSSIQTQFVNILKNVCKYVTEEATWLGRIEQAGTYNPGGSSTSYHRYALAIDMNTWYKYTDPITGKTYTPYTCSKMMGVECWNNYKSFICDVCLGKEDCKYNVNYIIYERYFKGNGWCWGGNWGPGSYDPIHIELRSGSCLTSNKQAIVCN